MHRRTCAALPHSNPRLPAGSPRHTAPRRPGQLLAIAAGLAFLYLVWGASLLGNHFAVQTIPAMILVGCRYFSAGVILFILSLATGVKVPRPRQWLPAACIGVLMIALTQWALIRAEEDLPSGVVALLYATLPLWTVLLQWGAPGGRRPPLAVLGGLLFGLAGIGLLVAAHMTHGFALAGLLAMGLAMLGAFSWACATLAVPRFKFTDSALMASAMQMMLGGGFLLVLSLSTHEWQGFSLLHVSRPSATAFVLLVLLPSVAGYPIYNWLLDTIDPALVSTFAYVNPVVAIFLGWAVAGEPLTLTTLLSTLLLVIGVVFITRAQGRPAASTAVSGPRIAAAACKVAGKDPLREAA